MLHSVYSSVLQTRRTSWRVYFVQLTQPILSTCDSAVYTQRHAVCGLQRVMLRVVCGAVFGIVVLMDTAQMSNRQYTKSIIVVTPSAVPDKLFPAAAQKTQ
jgi:hypothetical protein